MYRDRFLFRDKNKLPLEVGEKLISHQKHSDEFKQKLPTVWIMETFELI